MIGDNVVIWGLFAALCALAADQASKFYVNTDLLENKIGIMYTPFFNVIRAWNTGVSFSLFNDWGETGVWALSAFAAVVVLLLLAWMYKEKDLLIRIALGLIVGGAIGNIVDRIRFKAVFDFLDFHIGENHWPAFNLADSFICIGTVLVLIHALWTYFQEERK